MAEDLLAEFIHESREHLATIEADLLTIEEQGANLDEDLVNKVFRAAHSIKGGSSFFGLAKVKELAHKAETILDMLRARRMAPNAEVTNVLLAAFDQLRDMINRPGESDQMDVTELVISLTGLASSYLPQEEKAALTSSATLRVDGVPPVVVSQLDVDRARRSGHCIYCVDYDLIHDVEQKGLNLLKVFRELGEIGEIVDCLMDFDTVGTLEDPIGNRLPLRLVFATALSPDLMPELLSMDVGKIKLLFDPVAAAMSGAPAAVPAPTVVPPEPVASTPSEPVRALMVEKERSPVRPEPDREMPGVRPSPVVPAAGGASGAERVVAGPVATEETLRVNVGLLESLMNLAGELVLSRNQLRSAIAQNDMEALPVAEQRLNQVTSDLQDAIMRTRLQPIGNVLGKFPRVVRDMANALHKEIVLDIRGKDVALDRSLIEGLSDPLTHMVRNAVDHGIELPEDRVAAGKRSTGTVRIEARHEAGQVVVEIADDGKGIDANRVADAAVSKGLLPAEKVRAMSDREKTALIFLPGLSTARKVTDMSGRGVGMDVVKSNIDRLGGTVEIKSEPGKGSVFRIKMPLTLAIIPSLIVAVGGERFAIPQVNVEELLCLRPRDEDKRIEVVGEAEVLVLRDRILPLVRLRELLEAEPGRLERAGVGGGASAVVAEELRIVVMTTGSVQFGLAVDTFHDTEEIVVKPLGRHIKGLREYAGGTILGDGRVALILDASGLATKAELETAVEAARSAEEARTLERETAEEPHSFLVFHTGPEEMCATPLETVLRIQRVRPEQVETKASRRTIQYRGTSLPLVALSDVAQVEPVGEARELAVIVTSVHGRDVGLLGAMPVDVVETRTALDAATHRQRGIAGSMILNDRTILVANLVELVESAFPEWGFRSEANPVQESGGGETRTVVLAEDSDFFRTQVKRYLEQDGFRVLEAADGELAWDLLEANADGVDAVVTDVEMPRLSGLELTQRIRGDDRFARLPVIALSSLAGEDDIARGRAAGVDDYQVKLDRDGLTRGLQALIPG